MMNDKYRLLNQDFGEARQKAGGLGNRMGKVALGIYEAFAISDGWIAITPEKNRWVPLSACEKIVDIPEDDNPVEPYVAYPERIKLIFPDGMGGWQSSQTYRIEA